MPAWRIPLSDLDLGQAEEDAVTRVVRSQWLTLGAECDAFEREFAEFLGAEAAVGLSSCTAALHLACAALGVSPGDEVVVPTLTFVATANAVGMTGGTPVLADSIGPEDFTLDPADVERRITERTRGIICVHYAGFPCRMDAITDICDRHGLFLIEDVAHAPGARWDGRMLGTIGDVGCFSFFGNKNLTTGEGGMAVAREAAVHDRIKLLRSHGMTASSWDRFQGHAFDYDVVSVGFNYRPTELASAVGRVQLSKLRERNERRRALLERYQAQLDPIEGIAAPFAGRKGAAHLSVALVDDADRRDPLREALREDGIQTSLHYPPIHLFSHYRDTYGLAEGDLPVAEDLMSRAVTLPLYGTMPEESVDLVCESIASFCASG